MHSSRRKIPSKNFVRERCPEEFNSGVKGLMKVYILVNVLKRSWAGIAPCYWLDGPGIEFL
jgi:hypothetical protein